MSTLNLNRYSTVEIKSFDDYINQTTKLISFEDKDNQLILYRGQEEDWPLIPKIGRPIGPDACYSEKKESEIFNEFKRLSYPYLDSNFNDNDWNWLSLARHHNVPTRLLDWTENPLIALWFACYKKQENKSERVVWRFLVRLDELIDTKNESPFCLKNTGVFKPNHITKRITAQNGWFTVHHYSDNFKWDFPLESKKRTGKNLIKFIIADDLRNDILKKLDIMGINSFSIFPDLEGLGNYLQWKYFSHQ